MKVPSWSALFSTLAVLASVSPAMAMPQDGLEPRKNEIGQQQQQRDQTRSETRSSMACNNSPDLCDQSYGNVTHMGAHDSAFLRDASTGNSISGNQFYNATVALDAGIRLLSVQVHDLDGTIELCHSSCDLLDAGSLADWLTLIRQWMDANPNEVVTLLVVNSDDFTAAQLGSDFASSGIDQYGYEPSSTSSTFSWPTLRKMINSGKRLVTFVASIDTTSAYPYLLSEWTYVFETPYDVTSLSGFNCTADRPSTLNGHANQGISSGMLPLMNHFAYETLGLGSSIEYPDVDDIATTNSPATGTTGALGQHAQDCQSQWGGTKPTFVLVDFFNKGPALTTADNLNGVTNAVGRTAVPSDDSSSPQGAAAGIPLPTNSGLWGLALLVVGSFLFV